MALYVRLDAGNQTPRHHLSVGYPHHTAFIAFAAPTCT